MSKVYALLRESYLNYDNDYYTDLIIFKDIDSAQTYLEILKESITNEVLEEGYIDSIDDCYFYEDKDPNMFYMDIDDWGYEKLNIEEYEIMEFN